jgi:3-deoxy-7-phosphoheptulonate synthase
MPIPVAVEYLDVFTPQYFSNRVTGWAIWARTTESQEHRKMASWISGPIAFKNATNGNIDAAINAILSAQRGHTFLAITDEWHAAKVKTTWNLDTYILLRWGTTYEQRNYDKESITKVIERLIEEKITTGVWIDFSHGHSINPETGKKEAKQQLVVCENVSRQIADGNTKIVAAMIETNKNGKAYKHIPWKTPVSKIPEHTSITDEWLDSPDNRKALSMLNKAVEKRMKNI